MPRVRRFGVVPGIPDEEFMRVEAVPMTKEEARAVVLGKARLELEGVIWDVGCGTGTLTVEAALLAPRAEVWAVETQSVAVELTRRNLERFNVRNARVVEGMAPEVLGSLPDPDRVFVGGSGGRLKAILEAVVPRLRRGGRIVLPLVSPSNLVVALDTLGEMGLEVEAVSISIARLTALGGTKIFRALNPMYVVVASEGKEE